MTHTANETPPPLGAAGLGANAFPGGKRTSENAQKPEITQALCENSATRKGRGRSQKTLDIIKASISILEEIQPATVRGVCYRLFTRNLIANMSVGETQKISRILARARERGEVEWSWIVDETRRRERTPQWLDLKDFRDSIVDQYRRDFWSHQPETIEVWSEKGTVRGILAPVLEEFGVTFAVKHGFDSATSTTRPSRPRTWIVR